MSEFSIGAITGLTGAAVGAALVGPLRWHSLLSIAAGVAMSEAITWSDRRRAKSKFVPPPDAG